MNSVEALFVLCRDPGSLETVRDRTGFLRLGPSTRGSPRAVISLHSRLAFSSPDDKRESVQVLRRVRVCVIAT